MVAQYFTELYALSNAGFQFVLFVTYNATTVALESSPTFAIAMR
jgi:hypothetical protein